MLKKVMVLGAMVVSSLTLSLSANADMIYQSADVNYLDTDFRDVVFTLDKFDAQDGARRLDAVEFSMFGEVLSTAQVENFSSNSGSVIDILVSALISLKSSFGQDLVVALPSLNQEFAATAFDGNADWGGTSGATFEGLYSSNTGLSYITDARVMSLFQGQGTVDTFLSGLADTRATGGGNIFSGFSTDARAAVGVTYHFTQLQSVSEPPVSVDAPASMALVSIGAGLLMLIGRLRSRNQK